MTEHLVTKYKTRSPIKKKNNRNRLVFLSKLPVHVIVAIRGLTNQPTTCFLSQTNSKDGELDDKFQSLSLNNNEKKADTPIEEVIVYYCNVRYPPYMATKEEKKHTSVLEATRGMTWAKKQTREVR